MLQVALVPLKAEEPVPHVIVLAAVLEGHVSLADGVPDPGEVTDTVAV